MIISYQRGQKKLLKNAVETIINSSLTKSTKFELLADRTKNIYRIVDVNSHLVFLLILCMIGTVATHYIC